MLEQNERKRDYLLRYQRARKRKNEADEELDEICAVGSKAIVYTDMPHGSPDQTGIEKIAVTAERQLAELRRAAEACQRIRDEVRGAIEELPSETEQLVLLYRYMCLQKTEYEQKHGREGTRLLTWSEIAERTGYSVDWITHVHGDALAHMKMPENKTRQIKTD